VVAGIAGLRGRAGILHCDSYHLPPDIMRPPDPVFIHKSGLKNTIDFAMLWHLAQCGVTGSTAQGMADALNTPLSTIHATTTRLLLRKLVVGNELTGILGQPMVWVISRLGYRLMTGHLKAPEKPEGQIGLGSEIVHAS